MSARDGTVGEMVQFYNCLTLQSYWTCLFHWLGMSSLLAFIDKEIFEMFQRQWRSFNHWNENQNPQVFSDRIFTQLCFVPGGGVGPTGSCASDSDNKRCNFPDLVKLPNPEPDPSLASDIKFGNIPKLLEDTDQHNIGKKHCGNITFILA